jgi:carboxyl-terminal processing protease
MVVTPISGGPSDKLGIQSGDKIVKIEGENVAGQGITNRKVVNTLRGKKGTEVQVSIKRSGVNELLEFNIERDKIPLYSVDADFMVNDSVGYIKINRFSSSTYREFKKSMHSLKGKGLSHLILDLRHNPGGYMGAATKIADEFLADDKLIVYTKGRSEPRQDYHATSRGEFHEGEVAVLINRASASASEILAGAVQDWGRGTIVGRRSFGKGMVQEQHTFTDSSAVRLTIARYYTPAGRSIQKPYNEDFTSYYRELLERMKRGELRSEDSIELIDSLKYESPSGKTVYGGGGIMPDIFVPRDTFPKAVQQLARKGLIRQFAYNHVANHKDDLNSQYASAREFDNNFLVSTGLLQSLKDYAAKNKVELNSLPADARKEVDRLLKAHMAKQLWQDDGFYMIRQQDDKIFQSALHALTTAQSN